MAEPGRTLRQRYSALVCDLDGVVRRGPMPVTYAVERLVGYSDKVVYATNNASLTADDVATQLRGLGLLLDVAQVATSSQAGAAYLAATVPAGARVLAVGGPGVAAALTEVGLTAVRTLDDGGVVAVLQGYGPAVAAADLAEASYAIEAGAIWVATNTDRTLPTNRGVAPGNGALVEAVATATGLTATVVGKPEPALYRLALEHLGQPAGSVLAIGDRLDTDILGAQRAGLASLWVQTGVDDLVSLMRDPQQTVPTHVGVDLRVLDEDVAPATMSGGWWVSGDAKVRVDPDSGEVQVDTPAGTSANRLLEAGTRALVDLRFSGRRSAPVLERAATQVMDITR